ncbi:MAG: peptide deformylase [Patescibacteria group bacterium]|nr:peptide deformylase [Patescibacteria group bacterium]
MGKIYKIVTVPAKTLRQRSVEVDPKSIGTPEFQSFLDDLIATMDSQSSPAGIAAPQVGRNERIFIVNERWGPKVFINPEIEVLSEAIVESEEGCFSVPGVWGIVPRAKKVRLKALDRHGRKMEIVARAFEAIVLQHEFDHLEGVLFIDKMTHTTKGENTKSV